MSRDCSLGDHTIVLHETKSATVLLHNFCAMHKIIRWRLFSVYYLISYLVKNRYNTHKKSKMICCRLKQNQMIHQQVVVSDNKPLTLSSCLFSTFHSLHHQLCFFTIFFFSPTFIRLTFSSIAVRNNFNVFVGKLSLLCHQTLRHQYSKQLKLYLQLIIISIVVHSLKVFSRKCSSKCNFWLL